MRFPLRLIILVCAVFLDSYAFCQSPAPAGDPSAAPAAPRANQRQGGRAGGRSVAPQPQAGPQTSGRPGRSRRDQSGSGQYSMNFERADVQSVVKFLSMICKVPIVVSPDLKGSITIVCSKRLTLQECFQVIGAALRVRGFTMVGGLDSTVIRVLPLKRAVADTMGVQTGVNPGEAVSDEDLVTQVIPIQYASSDNLRDQLRPLVSADEAAIVSVAATNTLIITDNSGNIKRMLEIIRSVDTDTLGIIAVQVYQCKYASADSLVTTLNNLFQPKTGTGVAPQQGGRGGRGPGGGGATAAPDMGLAGLRGQINISSDTRTNGLIISGTRDRIEVVLEVIRQLDVDTLPEVKVKFFPLQYADAQTVATQMNNMFEQPQGSASQGIGFGFGGGRGNAPQAPASTSSAYAGLKRNVVTADVRTNSVVVTATDQNMKAFESMIKELDAPKVLSEVTRVYPLKYAKSAELATALTNLFRGNTASTGRNNFGVGGIFGLASSLSSNNNGPLALLQQITVISEPKTNSLLVTGPPNTAALMDTLIKQLDRRTQQVFIEVAIVDVTLDKNTQFGVEWQWQDAKNHASTNLGQAALTTGLKYSILNDNLQVLLHALQTRNNVKVLSTPTITTSDNVEAQISIGQNVPYVSNSTVTSGGNLLNTVAFQNVSISLTVTPHVNGSSDVIGLDVHQLINEIIGTDTALNAPIIAAREAQTSVTVRDGQTIAIGGIIQDKKTKTTSGIPLLSDLPLIGNLFKSTDNNVEKTELMVFLTPRILKADDDVTTVANETRALLSVEPPIHNAGPVNGGVEPRK